MNNDKSPMSGGGASVRSSTDQSSPARDSSQGLRGKANEAMNKIAEVAEEAGSQAKQHASSLAADAKEKTKGYFNRQVSSGATLAGHMAESIKAAADNLDPNAPQLAGFVRGAAEKINSLSDDMRDQSVDDLLRNASDFTRRQPALVFGLASLTGFFLFRALKAKPMPADEGSSTSGRVDHLASHSYGS